MKTVDDLRSQYQAARSDDQRTRILFGCEEIASPELLAFLLPIAQDPAGHDLTRIEAIKALGLAAVGLPERIPDVTDALAAIALTDRDTDVQTYALRSLAWFDSQTGIPDRVTPLLASEESNVRYAVLEVLKKHAHQPAARRILSELTGDAELGRAARRVLSESG
jgi:HEAT repeat protein